MAYAKPTPFERFLAWWWPSILAWLPARFVQRINVRKPLRFIHWSGEPLLNHDPASNHEYGGTVLILSRKLALVRQLRTPVANARRLRSAGRAQIEQLTPFHPNDVYFAIVPHPHTGRKDLSLIDADLIVVPKRTVDAVIGAARSAAIQLIAIDVAGMNQEPRGMDLLPDSARDNTGNRWQHWNFVLAVVCLLALAGISIGLLNARQQAVSNLEARFQPLRMQAADTLRRERALHQFEAMLRTTSRFVRPTTLEMLSELSARLPPDSHLTYFHLDSSGIAIRGATGNLADMLEHVGQSSRWKYPNLTGSRTLADGHSQEFSLTLALQQTPAKSTH